MRNPGIGYDSEIKMYDSETEKVDAWSIMHDVHGFCYSWYYPFFVVASILHESWYKLHNARACKLWH